MIYLFHGSDRQKILAKASKLVATLKERKPNASFFTMTEDDLDLVKISELSLGQGLFESKHVVILKNVFSKKEVSESLVELLPNVRLSENVFIFIEGSLHKNVLLAFHQNVEQIERYDLPNEKGKWGQRNFNVFLLADAFGEHDRKKLWILLVKALRAGIVPEELSGVLFSQIKNLIIARGCETAGEANLNPYVFSKAKRYGKNFKRGEAENLGKKLVALYHDAHRGLVDFSIGLETFVLSL